MYTRVKYNVLFSTDNGKLYRKLTKVLSIGCIMPYRDNSTKNRRVRIGMLTAYVSPIKTAVSEAYYALIDSVKRACKGSVILRCNFPNTLQIN